MYSDKGLGYTDLNNINVSLLCSHLHFHNTLRSTSCLLAVHFWYCRQTPVKDIYRTTFQRAMCHIYIYIYTHRANTYSLFTPLPSPKRYRSICCQTTRRRISFSSQSLTRSQHKFFLFCSIKRLQLAFYITSLCCRMTKIKELINIYTKQYILHFLLH